MKKILLASCIFLSVAVSAQDHLSASRSNLDGALAPFYHGVASGDPLTDRIILWTRITTQNPSETVGWQIAIDTTFATPVNFGSTTTDASSDFTVKVDVTGLQPNTWYYYRFSNNGVYSIIGRTRTMPLTHVSNLRFAVVACSNYQSGYFNAYRDIANRNDVDAVIHLGDYYYEYGFGDFDPGLDSSRVHESDTEVISLPLYRLRHSHYKLDPDLRVVHQQYPFITVWDDHETANDSWYGGADNHTPGTEGNWFDRKEDSRKAYFEWMPIRDVHNSIDTIHRVIPLGGLADLIMIDTRLEGREEQTAMGSPILTDTNRTMLGAAQLDWFKQQLSISTAKWKIVGNQVMMAALKLGSTVLNPDQWDGYPAEKKKVLTHIASNNIDNVVILTGDIHTSWANDIPHPDSTYVPSTGRGSVAVEYVCTSVTSGSFITFTVPASLITGLLPYIKYADLSKRGYLVLDITDQKVQGDWIYMSTITSKNFTATTAASWCDLDGANHLTQCGSPLTPRGTNPGLAPIISGIRNASQQEAVMVSIYPNPSSNYIAVQYYLSQPGEVKITLTDLSGKNVHAESRKHVENGLFNAGLDISLLPAGTYLMSLSAGDNVYSKQLVKAR
ncbi:MAG: alkaline phosphatase D family protein [Bacteroidota bacterium]